MVSVLQREADGTFMRTRMVSWDGSDWDDGFVRPDGYFAVYLPEHPAATASGWIRRHHAVWWLRTGEAVAAGMNLHHVNHDKRDDRFENLELISHGDHIRHHQAKAPVTLVCEVCSKTFAIPQWRINQGKGRWCSSDCYHARPISEETRQRHSASLKRAYAEGRR